MKLVFSYNLDKDVGNVIKSTEAVNNKTHTKFENSYIQKYGEVFTVKNIKEFIEDNIKNKSLEAESELVSIRERWHEVENVFVARAEKIFGIKYPHSIVTVYLSHNERCTYNIEKDYFFVKIRSRSSNRTIMHELFHFYTYHAFGEKLLAEGFSKNLYNDIKESLTELLNVEFADLMNGEVDKGYTQHQAMRGEIKNLWLQHKNLKEVIEILCKEY